MAELSGVELLWTLLEISTGQPPRLDRKGPGRYSAYLVPEEPGPSQLFTPSSWALTVKTPRGCWCLALMARSMALLRTEVRQYAIKPSASSTRFPKTRREIGRAHV